MLKTQFRPTLLALALNGLGLLSLVTLTGCDSTPSTPTQPSKMSALNAAPDWLLQPPADTTDTLYGIGSGKSRDDAIQNALADLTAKLGVTVSSQFSSQLNVKNRGFEWVKHDSQKTVKTQNVTLTLSNYEVVSSHQPLPTQVSVLIKTDKKRLTADTKLALNRFIGQAPWQQNNWATLGVIGQFQHAEKTLKALPEFERQLAVFKSLQPSQSVETYAQFIKQTEQIFLTTQNNLSFEVSASNAASAPFAKLLQQALAQNNLLKPQATARLVISVDEQISQAQGFSIVRSTFTLNTYEQSTLKAGQTLPLKGQGLQLNQAKNQVQQRFKEQIEQQSLLQILGISSPN